MTRYLAAAVGASVFGMAAQVHAAPPPASAFGRIPAVMDAEISPNGQRIAILGGLSDQRVVSIATIDQPGLPVLPLGDVEGVGVRWTGDDYLLANVAVWETLGDARRAYRFERQISITKDAKPAAMLLSMGMGGGLRVMINQPVLRVTLNPPRALIVGLADNSGASATKDTRIKRKGEAGAVRVLWKVDPATGQGVLTERGNDDTRNWSVDAAGEARVRSDVDEVSHRFSLYGRPKGSSQWSVLVDKATNTDAGAYRGYQESEDAVLLEQDGKVVLKRLKDGQVTPFGDAVSDDGFIWDVERGVVAGIRSRGAAPTTRWIDPEIGAAAGVLGRAFKGRDVGLSNWSSDRTRFVAYVTGPASPPVWYLYDRPKKEISLLAEEYPELKDATLGTTRFFTYRAADGLEIPAYLTLPPGAAAGAKPPLVVLPHGGPHARDAGDFDYLVQFLATRGYAVLRPQFRGSWGFGDELEKAGKGEWGGKMQTDLLDGVAAAAAGGDVDAKRVCIVGASFGGYAALAGAALHSDSYRCVASIAGIADLVQFIGEDNRLYGGDSESMDQLREDIGLADRAKVDAMSPLRHVADIRAPVLLIHGSKDTVVQIAQSQRMAAALKAAGKPYELIVLEGENHYLTKASNRTRMLEALEQFLAKNLPVNP